MAEGIVQAPQIHGPAAHLRTLLAFQSARTAVTDCRAMQFVKEKWRQFRDDHRNLVFGLSVDGVNPDTIPTFHSIHHDAVVRIRGLVLVQVRVCQGLRHLWNPKPASDLIPEREVHGGLGGEVFSWPLFPPYYPGMFRDGAACISGIPANPCPRK
eukprot:jgi/Mesvir1/19239/Mv26155-RA.1